MAAGANRSVSAAATPHELTPVSPTCGPGSATAGSDSTTGKAVPPRRDAAPRVAGPPRRHRSGTATSTLAAAAAGCGWATAAPREPRRGRPTPQARLTRPGRPAARQAPGAAGIRPTGLARGDPGCWRNPATATVTAEDTRTHTQSHCQRPDPTHIPSSTRGLPLPASTRTASPRASARFSTLTSKTNSRGRVDTNSPSANTTHPEWACRRPTPPTARCYRRRDPPSSRRIRSRSRCRTTLYLRGRQGKAANTPAATAAPVVTPLWDQSPHSTKTDGCPSAWSPGPPGYQREESTAR